MALALRLAEQVEKILPRSRLYLLPVIAIFEEGDLLSSITAPLSLQDHKLANILDIIKEQFDEKYLFQMLFWPAPYSLIQVIDTKLMLEFFVSLLLFKVFLDEQIEQGRLKGVEEIKNAEEIEYYVLNRGTVEGLIANKDAPKPEFDPFDKNSPSEHAIMLYYPFLMIFKEEVEHIKKQIEIKYINQVAIAKRATELIAKTMANTIERFNERKIELFGLPLTYIDFSEKALNSNYLETAINEGRVSLWRKPLNIFESEDDDREEDFEEANPNFDDIFNLFDKWSE